MAMGRVIKDSDDYGIIIRPMIGVPKGSNNQTTCRRCRKIKMSLVLYQMIGICWFCLSQEHSKWYEGIEKELRGKTYDVS